MKTSEQRINNIIGQLYGVDKMIKDDKDCFAVVTQMKAAKSAFSSLFNSYIEENFISCLGKCGKGRDDDFLKKLIAELTK